MRFLIAFVLAVIAALGLIACHSADLPTRVASSATPAKPTATPAIGSHADGARRITTGELEDLLKKGQAVVIDVRNEQAYNTGHIRGAKLIPYDKIVERSKELPRDKTIVTYCS